MSDARSDALGNAEIEVEDCRDVLMVIMAVLTAETNAVPPMMRDALATVARLGRGRADYALASLKEARGANHG